MTVLTTNPQTLYETFQNDPSLLEFLNEFNYFIKINPSIFEKLSITNQNVIRDKLGVVDNEKLLSSILSYAISNSFTS
jgi:hypothetical protein